VAHYSFIIGIFWLVAAFWIDAGLSEAALWAGILPVVWLISLPLLKS
jgi:hypothetical protein